MDSHLVVLDFETSGMSPECGDRAIEIGAVKIEDGAIVDRFQSLMNPQRRINAFIENFTGITNSMLAEAPPAEKIMMAFDDFIGDAPLVAHNASFDRRFLDAELSRIDRRRRQPFGCSMLAARRVYPDAPNHKLETLVRYRNLPSDGTFHRALADSEMTARLWLAMCDDLMAGYGLPEVDFELMCSLSNVGRARAAYYLRRVADSS